MSKPNTRGRLMDITTWAIKQGHLTLFWRIRDGLLEDMWVLDQIRVLYPPVVGLITAPKWIHILIPGTCECVMLYGKGE